MRYVAFLRGINVGGRRVLPMAELRSTAQAAGFSNVATYIQSGNLFVDSDEGASSVAIAVHDLILAGFDYDLPVVVRSHNDIVRVIATNPFVDQADDPKHLHVGFLSTEPSAEAVDALAPKVLAGEEFAVMGSELFLHLPHGTGKSKLMTYDFAKALGVDVTVRNWRTVQKALVLLADV